MGKVTVSTKNLEKLLNGIKNIEGNIDKVAEESLNQLVQVTIAHAKKGTIKGEGDDTHLRDHYFATETVKKGNVYSKEVKNDARNTDGELYLIYYENGHRTRLGMSQNPKYKPKQGAVAWVPGRYPLMKATVKARAKSAVIISGNMKKYFEVK